jgi:two-component system LytT family sensor kinase
MTDAYLVIQTLGFATGTALFGLLTVLSWKAQRRAKGTWSGGWAAAMGWFWNAANLAKYVVVVGDGSATSLAYRLADVFAWAATAVLPTAFLLLLQPVREGSVSSRRSRWLFRLSWLNAAGLTIGFFAACLLPGFPVRFSTIEKLSAYNLTLHVIAAAIVFRSAGPMTPARRIYWRTMSLLLTALVVSALLYLHLTVGPPLKMVFDIIAQQSSIPMAIATFAFLAQFHFADVFVKRSLTILAAVTAAFIYVVLVVDPLLRAIRGSAVHSDVSVWVAATVLWCAPLLLFPALDRVVGRAADRWVFRRPDYRRLAHTFVQESEPLDSEPELFALAEQRIQAALDVATVRVVSYEQVKALGDGLGMTPDDVVPLPPGHPARKLLGGPDVEVLVPVEVHTAVESLLAVAPGEQGRKLLSDEVSFLLALAERMGRKVESLRFERERRERQLRESRLQHLLTQAEIKALRAQIHPHFLFNTLNTIADLIGSDPDKAETMTERLADVFRYLLTRTDRNVIAVSEEIEFLRTYLEIERVRFGDRLRIELAADASIASEPIPSLILQPLVENAIKHGLAPKRSGGAIFVRAIDEGAAMRLIVQDDGVGWRDAPNGQAASDHSRPGGVGLRNVTERLRTLYGDRAEITVRSQAGQGTCVSIVVPKYQTSDLRPQTSDQKSEATEVQVGSNV